ncbi:unnamed protein product [Candida verbasci]|uniref:Myb-like domain-containing protein n=1 Tax=Candida verbasci TaxID=1227364 RepID=A0A9W4U1A7_9ASCO|nr:unnamed protein product [Candida verbasci]
MINEKRKLSSNNDSGTKTKKLKINGNKTQLQKTISKKQVVENEESNNSDVETSSSSSSSNSSDSSESSEESSSNSSSEVSESESGSSDDSDKHLKVNNSKSKENPMAIKNSKNLTNSSTSSSTDSSSKSSSSSESKSSSSSSESESSSSSSKSESSSSSSKSESSSSSSKSESSSSSSKSESSSSSSKSESSSSEDEEESESSSSDEEDSGSASEEKENEEKEENGSKTNATSLAKPIKQNALDKSTEMSTDTLGTKTATEPKQKSSSSSSSEAEISSSEESESSSEEQEEENDSNTNATNLKSIIQNDFYKSTTTPAKAETKERESSSSNSSESERSSSDEESESSSEEEEENESNPNTINLANSAKENKLDKLTAIPITTTIIDSKQGNSLSSSSESESSSSDEESESSNEEEEEEENDLNTNAVKSKKQRVLNKSTTAPTITITNEQENSSPSSSESQRSSSEEEEEVEDQEEDQGVRIPEPYHEEDGSSFEYVPTSSSESSSELESEAENRSTSRKALQFEEKSTSRKALQSEDKSPSRETSYFKLKTQQHRLESKIQNNTLAKEFSFLNSFLNELESSEKDKDSNDKSELSPVQPKIHIQPQHLEAEIPNNIQENEFSSLYKHLSDSELNEKNNDSNHNNEPTPELNQMKTVDSAPHSDTSPKESSNDSDLSSIESSSDSHHVETTSESSDESSTESESEETTQIGSKSISESSSDSKNKNTTKTSLESSAQRECRNTLKRSLMEIQPTPQNGTLKNENNSTTPNPELRSEEEDSSEYSDVQDEPPRKKPKRPSLASILENFSSDSESEHTDKEFVKDLDYFLSDKELSTPLLDNYKTIYNQYLQEVLTPPSTSNLTASKVTISGLIYPNISYLPGIQWTALEKEQFFFALSRHSIHDIESIKEALPEKSEFEIITYYNVLKSGLNKWKPNKLLMKNSELPIAYEMSKDYIELEQKIADLIPDPKPHNRPFNDEDELLNFDNLSIITEVEIKNGMKSLMTEMAKFITRKIMLNLTHLDGMRIQKTDVLKSIRGLHYKDPDWKFDQIKLIQKIRDDNGLTTGTIGPDRIGSYFAVPPFHNILNDEDVEIFTEDKLIYYENKWLNYEDIQASKMYEMGLVSLLSPELQSLWYLEPMKNPPEFKGSYKARLKKYDYNFASYNDAKKPN